MRLAALALPLLLSLAACALDGTERAEDGEDALTWTSVYLEGGGATLRVTKSGVPHACAPVFDGEDGRRWSCKAGSQLVELIVRTRDALMLTWPKGRGADQKTVLSCKVRAGSTTAPTRVSCKAAAPTERPSTGGLSSPFAPTAEGFSFPNVHAVDTKGAWLRGMTPRADEDFAELDRAGVLRVLIFKNPTTNGDDVSEEIEKLGLPQDDAKVVPFPWKDMPAFSEGCRMTLEGLRFLRDSRAAKKKAFFHCTVGEDRTGHLASLARAIDTGADPVATFQDEACENGFGAGNPQKPAFVVREIDKGLAPLARKMAWLVATGKLTSALEDAACAKDPATDPSFVNDARFAPSAFACGTSTRYRY
jgi:hypothetical protein